MKNNKVAKRTRLNRLGPTTKNPCWKKATESQKFDFVMNCAGNCKAFMERGIFINIPLSITNCHDVLCKNELHRQRNG